MSALNNSLLLGAPAGAGGYSISRSLRFSSADSSFLSRTPASAGDRRKWTFAAWVKRSGLGAINTLFFAGTSSTNLDLIRFDASDRLDILWFYGGVAANIVTTPVYRDPSAWLHLVVSVDTTQATASNRIKAYINGSQVTTLTTATYPTQNTDSLTNSTNAHNIGRDGGNVNYYLNSYLADCFLIDSQALDPTAFGEFSATTGVWVPKAYSGPAATGNSFWLPFSDNSAATATTLGKDNFNLGNNFTPNNLSVTAGAGNDSLVDVPTNGSEVDTGLGNQVRGNYCTWNPTNKSTYAAMSNGNLDIVSSNNHGQTLGTIGVQSGKWYWEVTKSTSGNPYTAGFGVMEQVYKQDASFVGNGVGRNFIYLQGGDVFWYNGSAGSGAFTNSALVNNTGVWMFALDLDAQKMWFGKDGTWYSTTGSTITGPSSGLNAPFTSFTAGSTYFPFHNSDSTAVTYVANFGQRSWAYQAPAGYKSLNTASLPAPVVTKPSDLFQAITYTGNGSTQTISGLGFSPDLVWLKSRSNALNHRLIDRVQGNTSTLASNLTTAAVDCSSDFTAFTSDGFSLNQTLDFSLNASAYTYAAWCWDAGNTTVTNTQGSISSQVRANASAGFSIVTYTGNATAGTTVGHGLGVAPSMIIFKNRDAGTVNWLVYHSSLGATGGIPLNTTDAFTTNNNWLNSTSPSSSVFTVGLGQVTNGSGEKLVAYCFAPVVGYSSMGSYVGNGSSDGVFVHTGFRPRWLLVKSSSDNTTNWIILDSARDSYNVSNLILRPDLANAEVSDSLSNTDFLANGFKLKASGSFGINRSGTTFIYCAFAESPFAANNRAR